MICTTKRRRIRSLFLASAFSVLAVLPFSASPSKGWQGLLDSSDLVKTEAALKSELVKNPKDAEAAVGLAFLQRIKGEREKSVVTAVEGLRNAPDSPLSFILEDFISDDATFDQATMRLVKDSLAQLASARGMDPVVRFSLRWLGYNLAARSGDRTARLEAMEQAGFVPAAYFTKPETERSRLAFYDREPVEKGDIGGTAWTYSRLDGILARPPLYDMPDHGESNYYILVPFTVAKRTEALIYLNASKSFRVVLDDRVLLVKDVFEDQENPTAVHEVRLLAGAHRLLIKLHAAQIGDGIHVALLDGEGNPLPVRWASSAIPPKGGTAGFKDEGASEGLFWTRFDRKDPRWLGFEALWNKWLGDVAKGRILMEDAAEQAPGSILWNCLSARMYLFESDDLPTKIAQSRAERSLDRALRIAPDCPMALYFKALLAGTNSDTDEDLVLLRRLTEDAPSDPRWFVALASRLESKGWMNQARKVLQAASSYHPDCESVLSAWIDFDQKVPDLKAEARAIRRLEKLRNADPEWETYYAAAEQWQTLEDLIKREISRYGDRDLLFEYKLARLELKREMYASARKRLEKLVSVNSDSSELTFYLARCCFLMGDKAAGFKAWDALKAVKPDAFQVDLARMILGIEPLPFQNRHIGLKQVLAEDKTRTPDQSPSSQILDQMFTRVEPDGSSIERYHGILRINDKQGVDKEGEQDLPGQIILSIRTIKPDGEILEPEQIPDKQSISLQGLEPGDLVEYEYITLKPPSLVKKDAYITSQVFLFQDIDKPYHRTQWYLEYPKAIPMQFLEKHLPSPGTSGASGDMEWRDWDYRHMPLLPREPNAPNRLLFVPMVEAVGGITWHDVGLYLKDSLTGSFQITPEVVRRYKEAVDGALTDEARLKDIIHYCLKEVDGEGQASWQDPTMTLLTRNGSRLPVACAFLKLAGIPYQILIAEATPDRVLGENLPRLGQFRYPVLEVDLPKARPMYFTLDSPYRDPYILPWFLEGARALQIMSDKPWHRVDIPLAMGPWAAAGEHETRDLMADGDLRVVHTGTLDPDASESMRSALHKIAADQQRRVIQMALSRRYGNIDLVDYKLDNLKDASQPMGWNYTVVVHGFANADGGSLVVSDPLPALHLGQAFASLKERKLPESTGGPIFINQTITYTLPDGARTDYSLPSLDLKTEFGSYSLSSEAKDGKLIIRRRLEMPYQIVWPDKYERFAAFLQKIDSAESGQMVVTLSK